MARGKVRNTINAFESVWLRALVRRSDKLAALIPQLYVKGLTHHWRLTHEAPDRVVGMLNLFRETDGRWLFAFSGATDTSTVKLK
jgi:hypothetical protein